jgi:hypothetical protein
MGKILDALGPVSPSGAPPAPGSLGDAGEGCVHDSPSGKL